MIKGKNISIIELLDDVYGGKKPVEKGLVENLKNEKLGYEQLAEATEYFREAKRFLLNVENIQNTYAGEFNYNKWWSQFHLSRVKNFILPFDTCLFAFDNPLEILWSDLNGQEKGFKRQEILGLSVRQMRTAQEMLYYRMYIYFLDGIEGDKMMTSNQFIDFVVDKIEDGIIVYHQNHLCGDKDKCKILGNGNMNVGEDVNRLLVMNSDGHFPCCQEYQNRKALVETLLYFVNEINTKDVIKKKPEDKEVVLGSGVGKELVVSPYYNCNISEKRYAYDSKDIRHGTGSKHAHKYDVRRHARIVDGHIIWINPHIRGTGEYIPKTYSRNILQKGYITEKVQGLSRFRFVERIMVFIIKWFRKLKQK